MPTMDQLTLHAALCFNEPAVIAFYGGGGKTALISKLAAELTDAGKKVLITTTTKIFVPTDIPLFLADNNCDYLAALKKHFTDNNIAVTGKRILHNSKIEGLQAFDVKRLRDELRVIVLVEADGSKGLPIKGYAAHEPALPACSDLTVAVIGADCLGARISPDVVHRTSEFVGTVKNKQGTVITEETIVIAYKEMLTRSRLQAPEARRYCILNKADLLKKPGITALKTSKLLANHESNPECLLLTSANVHNPVKINLSLDINQHAAAVSCVVLAAGTARRMGMDKLTLPYKDTTILEQTLSEISISGFAEIIVVCKPGSFWIKKLDPEQYRVVINPAYQTGLSSSLKTGLASVSSRAQGAVFALADQPLVPSTLYKQLIRSYRKKLNLITCPLYQGKRGNPTLFDRRTWPDLMQLTGDKGGRLLLKKTTEDDIIMLESDCPAVITDLDTPDDYLTFLKKNP